MAISIIFSVSKVILSALVLDTSHTLESNYLLDHLQHSTKAVKFMCGDNKILNNATLQVFVPIFSSVLTKGIFIKL